MKYLLALLLFISSGLLSAQEITATGNIVDPTKWNNVIPMTGTQLSQVEGSGGGPVPAYNTDTNTIRFSFFPYTVSQIIAINSVLSGQGISVGGFNYSWKIYNDLENCCGTRGTLVGNVNFFNNSGKVVESYTYDYSLTNTGADFKKFTGTETFSSPYQLNSLGDISVSWTGKDMNFWSGYYGPRVRDTSITLNYTTASTPSSPTTTTTPTSTTAATTTTNEIIAAAAEPVAPIQTTQTTATVEATIQPVVATTAPATSTTTSTTTSTINPVAVVETTKEKSVTGPSLSSILSNIKNNQDRQNAIAMSAVADSNKLAESVVQQAEKIAMDIAGSSAAASTNVTGAGFTLATESKIFQIARSISPISTTMSNMNNGSIYALRPESRNIEAVDSQSIFQENKIQLLKPPSTDTLLGNTNNDNVNNFGIAFGKRGDPIQDYIEASNIMLGEMKAETKTTVKQNVQDNDLAGGVKIERMAVVPNGFNAYSAFILTNIAFYEPKEIYKNNVPKDNVRSMYFLEKGNTDTFNKMIEAQYK